MCKAIEAKSAKARATIAANLLKRTKAEFEAGCRSGLGRSFDNCFEMGDGEQVRDLLIERAKTDAELLYAFSRHCQHIPKEWYDRARGAKTDAQVFAEGRA